MHNPFVPETLEGWSVLHLMYRVRWDRLRSRTPADREHLATEAVRALAVPDAGSTAFVQVLGHKADLMVICFRRSFDELAQAQLALSRSELHDALEPTSSYVSVVELGMYEMTAKIHEQLSAKFKPGSDEFEKAFDEEMAVAAPAGDEPAVPRHAEGAIRLFLSDEQAARRGAQLVHRSFRAARVDDARARNDRTAVRRKGHAGDFRLDRLRRLGVGRRSVRRRSDSCSRN